MRQPGKTSLIFVIGLLTIAVLFTAYSLYVLDPEVYKATPRKIRHLYKFGTVLIVYGIGLLTYWRSAPAWLLQLWHILYGGGMALLLLLALYDGLISEIPSGFRNVISDFHEFLICPIPYVIAGILGRAASPRKEVTILLLLTTLGAFSQDNTPPDWGAFSQRIDISAWHGHRFRITAAVRTECLDPKAGAEVWVRIDKIDKTMGFFYNMMDKPIRDSGWKVYTITGKVDRAAQWISFGGLYQHKGYFYFDDFHLAVENSGKQWQELPLNDPGFEDDTATLNKHWFYLRKRSFFAPRLSTDQPYEGKWAFRVDGSQFTIPQTYGSNDTAGRFITANGISLYYETYGNGQPLLLLHGNSSSISTFDKQIPDLAKQYKVIAVDSRGQGRSGEDGKRYTYDLFAADMNSLLDSLRLDSVDILGWSDGGNTGLIMAMNYPRKVRRLAVMGANVFIDHSVVDGWVFRTLRKEQRELKGDTLFNSANRNRLITLLLTEPRHSFDQLGAIRCPVLVMAGEKDVIREGHTRQIAAHIPQSKLLIFPGGTHYEPTEHPDTFNKAVLDFLAAAVPAP